MSPTKPMRVSPCLTNCFVMALRKRGIAVPKDVAVTGFDNQEEIAKMDAFLTTVRVGNTRLGKRLACQLLFRMQHTELPPEVGHM